jgi:hypothetical protein
MELERYEDDSVGDVPGLIPRGDISYLSSDSSKNEGPPPLGARVHDGYYDSDEEEEEDDNVDADTTHQEKEQEEKAVNLSPHTIAMAKRVGDKDGNRLFRTLMDSGSTYNLIKRSALPKGTRVHKLAGRTIQTANGGMKVNEFVYLGHVSFPEFAPNQHINGFVAMIIDDDKVHYDLIVGRKVMKKMKLTLDFDNRWCGWIRRLSSIHLIGIRTNLP